MEQGLLAEPPARSARGPWHGLNRYRTRESQKICFRPLGRKRRLGVMCACSRRSLWVMLPRTQGARASSRQFWCANRGPFPDPLPDKPLHGAMTHTTTNSRSTSSSTSSPETRAHEYCDALAASTALLRVRLVSKMERRRCGGICAGPACSCSWGPISYGTSKSSEGMFLSGNAKKEERGVA